MWPNFSLHDIQFFAPMDNLKDKIIINISKGVDNNILSNDDLLQIFECAGDHLNLCTISKYATRNDLSYNGAKNNRNVKKIFGVRFVVDNK